MINSQTFWKKMLCMLMYNMDSVKDVRVEEHIFALTCILRNILCNKRNKFVAYLDAEKAFDKINRCLLLFKLRRIGVTGLLYKAI